MHKRNATEMSNVAIVFLSTLVCFFFVLCASSRVSGQRRGGRRVLCQTCPTAIHDLSASMEQILAQQKKNTTDEVY